jgi:hypothetical protein
MRARLRIAGVLQVEIRAWAHQLLAPSMNDDLWFCLRSVRKFSFELYVFLFQPCVSEMLVLRKTIFEQSLQA